MGPKRAAELALAKYRHASKIKVTLYGSLAATGKGHLTHTAISSTLGNKLSEIIWKPDDLLPLHPNGMAFDAIDKGGNTIERWETYSVGGGALSDDENDGKNHDVYKLTHATEIINYCNKQGISLWEFIEENEGNAIWDFLNDVWKAMQNAIERGLSSEGVLSGNLKLQRKARSLYKKAEFLNNSFRENGLLASFAHAVSEENASGAIVVTAPTCGASGVVPAVLYYLYNNIEKDTQKILRALATAALFGNIAKTNGSISGAQIGCQGEVGVACAMAAAAAVYILGGSNSQSEYAAEMGLEHHLGLTCDPVEGLVQIPCIERNAHAAIRAMGCCHMALLSDGLHKISYDEILNVCMETGSALPSLYKETAKGGLAKMYRDRVDSR